MSDDKVIATELGRVTTVVISYDLVGAPDYPRKYRRYDVRPHGLNAQYVNGALTSVTIRGCRLSPKGNPMEEQTSDVFRPNDSWDPAPPWLWSLIPTSLAASDG